ncbi:MAG: DMT family transporter [Alphaproteobacteria bacterium]
MTETDSSTTEGEQPLPKVLPAVALMVFATLCAAVMAAMIRGLATELHPVEIAFFRNLVGVLMLSPLLLRGGMAVLKTGRPGLHVIRAASTLVAMLTLYTALSLAPLALVTALNFTAPLFTALLAIVLLGEKVGRARIIALLVGFAGTVIILRPGIETITFGAVLVLISSLAWASTLTAIKELGRDESSLTITAIGLLLVTPLSLIPALFFWQTPTWSQAGWLVGIGVVGTLGQWAIAQAFRQADATAVLPLDFLRLVWASALGLLIFHEWPSLWTWIGAGVIVASTTYLGLRENRRQVAQNTTVVSGS